MRGLEPPRCHHHRLLRPARLPVPPHPHAVVHYANGLRACQETLNCPQTHRLCLRQSLWIDDHAANAATRAIPPGVVPSAIAQAIADARAARTATINASVFGVVAVHKLAALLTVVTAASVSPVSGRAIAVNPI